MLLVPRLILAAAASLSLAAASLHSPVNGNCSRHDLNVLSCSPESLNTDACCVESPGGLLLLTQLYSNVAGGPENTWTIHGLWNDYCNGSYPSSCDPSRDYVDIAATLEEHRQTSLLDYIKENWRNDPVITTSNGTDEELWEHEWSKHGTCMTTLRPSCYTHYTPQLELLEFLHEVVYLHKQLPTQDYLASCGIVPASNTTYALADIEACFIKVTGGYLPHIGCTNGSLSEVWYYHHLAGRVKGGHYVPTNTTYGSNCPKNGIAYPPKPAS